MRRKYFFIQSFLHLLFAVSLNFMFTTNGKSQDSSVSKIHVAPAPLFRDPITDGAADPVIIWNREEKSWWMLYSQRRANVESADVAFCYGTAIGIASSKDSGQTWVYRGTLNLDFDKGMNTFWAPDIVYNNGEYHMFVVYIEGVRNHWGGKARMAHYTAKNLWEWKFKGFLKLTSENVIDASLFKMPDGKWRMWYKDETKGSAIMMAESNDLYKWSINAQPAIGGTAQEGPKIFRFGNYYWMLTDEWHGMRVYRSKDCNTWKKQGIILEGPSQRTEDRPSGAHGDVIVVDNKAYVFYFTHPGRKSHFEASLNTDGNFPYNQKRSSIQVAPLEIKDETLVSDRSKPFDFWLSKPD